MICRRARPRYRNLQVGAAVPAAIPRSMAWMPSAAHRDLTPSFAKEGWGRFCRSDVRCTDPCRSGGPRRDSQVYAWMPSAAPPRSPGLWHECRQQPRRDPKTPPLEKEGWGGFCRSDVRCTDPCRSGGLRRDPQVYGMNAVSSPPRPNPLLCKGGLGWILQERCPMYRPL